VASAGSAQDLAMKRLAKRLVIGRPWEETVRRVHHAVTGSRNSLYDAQTIEVMRRVLRPDSNAIDVGAFEGGMLRHMIRLAPRGRHFAFEPLPGRAEALAARFPMATVRPFAIGESPGEAEFVCVTRSPALSGLLARPDLAPDEPSTIARVRVETIDRVIPADAAIALVKVDVEGGELGVFRGGVETLRRNRPVVVFECGLAARAWGAPYAEIHATLARAGLRVSTLDAWLSGEAALPAQEFVRMAAQDVEFYFIASP
jgi:FkbM family methyltransferase